MERIDLFRAETDKLAVMLTTACTCISCPMSGYCAEFEDTYDRADINTVTCYEMWCDYLRENPQELENVNEVAEMLESVVDCEKCPINDDCVRYGVFGDSAECEFEFEQWLNEEVTPAVATCRKIRPVEERENVIHPQHYLILPGVEVKDISDAVLDQCGYDAVAGAYLFNILKYVLRADRKNGIEDYKKALVYMGWLIQRLEKAEHVEEGKRHDYE